MKNLKLCPEKSSNLELQSKEEAVLFSAFDIEQSRLFFASSANLIYTTHLPSSLDGRASSKLNISAEVQQLDLEDGDFITSLDYILEKEALIIGTSDGLLLLHSVDGSNATEVVGKVEGGVKCISPSPDGDLLGVISGFGQMLVMTPDWDLLYEISLEDLPGDIDVSQQNAVPGSSESPISWRGDGKYFATLSEVPNSSALHKKLKIWERESGTLHASSESKVFMGAAFDWMPSGAKIATVHDRKPENKCPSIVFFERNGLERSSFSINELIDATVETLKWNCSSDLLAAIVRFERYDSVKIWHFSNNHWYLKHEIRYSRQDGVRFMWDPTKPLQLICWTLSGQLSIYNFFWMTAVTENSTAFVIDGSEILVSPLSLSLMPPPMHLFKLKFSSAVRDIAFSSKSSKIHLAALLSDGCLSVAELPALDSWEDLEGQVFKVEALDSETALECFTHLIWLDPHILLGFGFSKEGRNRYYLQEIELVCAENCVPGSVMCSGWQAKMTNLTSLEGLVIAIAANPAKTYSAFVQFDGGKISEYTSKLGPTGFSKHDDLSFASPCSLMSAVSVSDGAQLRPLLFGLDDISRLHASGRILCNNCSSFSFYSNFDDQVITHLILTTKQDVLFIVDISDLLSHEDLEVKYENFVHVNKRREEESRNFINIWERGSKIVGVLHGDEAAILLQTTRGNLECIYPRKLVLTSIANALSQGRFKDALLMVRRHRIDFNFIVDYFGWQAFLPSATEFVKQIDNLSYITEFVCSIKNENITETLYKNSPSLPFLKDGKDTQAPDIKGSNSNSKVTSVLLAIRRALEDHVPETPARELCILTTLARSDPPALEEALERIKLVREMELSGLGQTKRTSYPSAEEALKHLLWLSDSEAIFEAALGLYDLNLTAMVALNSQRDPKEFLPFLQELERMPTILMHYNIDLRLHRYEKALKHIVSAGDAYYADCMNLMKSNPQLFPMGLQLITDGAKRAQVLEAWGDHLYDQKSFEDAATNFLCCSKPEKALKAYRACGQWSGVLTVAGFLKLGTEEITKLAHELCEELQALGKPVEAAKVALDYCGDVSYGVSLLVNARDWEEALRVGFMHRRDDLISEVKNAAVECARVLIGEYEEGLEKIGKYLARYLAVRQRRLLLAVKIQSETRSINDLDDDTASEASSSFSGMSAYTTGTRTGSIASISSSTASKSRGKGRQRNRGKIRAGSPDEEMALVEHLKGMALAAGAQRELKSLLVSLVILGNEQFARKVHRTAENFQLSQIAAVKLAADTISSVSIDEHAHTLENYLQRVRSEPKHLEDSFWWSKVLLSS